MYNNPYMNNYMAQPNVERINAQISELEKMKEHIQKPVQPPITQNFQIAPTNREVIRYANSIDEVQRDMVIGDTPYFSRDMSIVWVKNTKGDIKTYELNEVVLKDEKDMKIEYLEAQINELKGMIKNESNADIDEPITDTVESKKSSSVSTVRTIKKKQ